MKVLLEIPDEEASFGLKVLKNLAFVKKAMPISTHALDLFEDLKEVAE